MSERIHRAIDAALAFDDSLLEETLAMEYDPNTMDCELRQYASALWGAHQVAQTVIRWREQGVTHGSKS